MAVSEMESYEGVKNVPKEAIEREIECLQTSLPFYFFSVKYNYLLFFVHISKRCNRKDDSVPAYIFKDGLFSVDLDEGNSFAYSYSDDKWYFASSRYPSSEKVEIVDITYINAIKKSFRRIYGLKFLYPRMFA